MKLFLIEFEIMRIFVQIDNHDNPRVPARFDARYVDGLNMMVLLLPGTAITYYGDEIGMKDTKILPNQTMDRLIPSRDPERTPFQWNDSINAGILFLDCNFPKIIQLCVSFFEQAY